MQLDELNGYEYTDKVVRYVSLRFIRMFNQTKLWKKKKPKELIDDFLEFYEDLMMIAEDAYLEIAKYYYKPEEKKTEIDKKWVRAILNDYDPVTKYVFTQETDRKRSRFTEAYIASEGAEEEITTALKLWSNQVRQFADTVTDLAILQAMKDDGIKKGQWMTEEDERVCAVCLDRRGKIYPLSKIPAKPHHGCRCWIKVVNGKSA